jgi:hypothetical protein
LRFDERRSDLWRPAFLHNGDDNFERNQQIVPFETRGPQEKPRTTKTHSIDRSFSLHLIRKRGQRIRIVIAHRCRTSNQLFQTHSMMRFFVDDLQDDASTVALESDLRELDAKYC